VINQAALSAKPPTPAWQSLVLVCREQLVEAQAQTGASPATMHFELSTVGA
jgi:hypothetical protein